MSHLRSLLICSKGGIKRSLGCQSKKSEIAEKTRAIQKKTGISPNTIVAKIRETIERMVEGSFNSGGDPLASKI